MPSNGGLEISKANCNGSISRRDPCKWHQESTRTEIFNINTEESEIDQSADSLKV